jgi:hypothetical protein
MKKTLLFVSLFVAGASFAQDCSKIFISEYVEGWSNNKALEIYNPTNQSVNLNEYFVARYSNGSTSATVLNSIQLTGTLGPNDVYVAVLDKRDPNGTGQEAPLWDSLIVKADGFYAPIYELSNSFYWNGDDAIVLAKGTLPSDPNANVTTAAGFQIIDIFGRIGERPTNANGTYTNPTGGWSTAFPYSTGQGVIVTVDHSMIRKASVKAGTTTPVSFFDPLAEWDTIPAVTYLFNDNGDTLVSGTGNPILFGNWFSLGSHQCECGDASIKDVKNVKSSFSVFPNPSSNGLFNVVAAAGIENITIYNSLGQVVKTQKFNTENASIKISDNPGVYIMKVQTGNGMLSKRVIIK